jgi:hypothetical protein
VNLAIVRLAKAELRIPVMATRLLEARSLIDEFLPKHDFSAVYEIRINAASS